MTSDGAEARDARELPPTIIDATDRSPVILHAPHGSTRIPVAFRSDFVIDDAALERELLALTDHGVDRMVRRALDSCAASAVIAEVSRLVVDVERFPSDEEEMNAVGMGVLYTHGAWRERIREVPEATRVALMAHFERYSLALERLVDRAVERHGRAVVIDVHSYAMVALPYELHADDRRPALCIGYDERHVNASLLDCVRAAFRHLEPADNEPFAGAYVPLKHFGRDRRVQSVMLELRRDRYMDERSGRLEATAVDALGDAVAQLAKAAEVSG